MKIVALFLSVVFGEFVATDEWQRVPENVPLPQGLHYRINLETGVKEAKLLRDHSDSAAIVPTGDVQDLTPKRPELNEAQKKSLEKINDYLKTVAEKEKELRSFEDLDVEMVVEFELMENITRQFVSSSDLAVQSACLEELEFLVHQVDNAADFVKLGGIDLVLDTVKVNNQSNKLLSGAAQVLAAAAQGNNAVQIHILKQGGVEIILSKLTDSGVDTLDKKRLVFALSAAIRNFPAAQKAFLKSEGIGTLAGLVQEPTLARNIITLFSDLVEEEVFALGHKEDSEEAGQRATQYSRNGLKQTVKEAHICQQMVFGFESQSGRHSTIEAILKLISNLECSLETLRPHLEKEGAGYADLCAQESADSGENGYFCNILENIQQFIRTRDEL